jgi:hypothetical protein
VQAYGIYCMARSGLCFLPLSLWAFYEQGHVTKDLRWWICWSDNWHWVCCWNFGPGANLVRRRRSGSLGFAAGEQSGTSNRSRIWCRRVGEAVKHSSFAGLHRHVWSIHSIGVLKRWDMNKIYRRGRHQV